ncbi:hypothetical protein DL767_008942 [Monosporascus sp. MG133]|nr:hypothetical protein DL767_008942 [Monosporascus sp. MG133]
MTKPEGHWRTRWLENSETAILDAKTPEIRTSVCIAMTAKVSQYGWATAEGWEQHRQTITDLYFYQNKKLRELKVIMEQEYHFFATDKMYKTHFKQWDIHKNCKHPRAEGSSTSSKHSKGKSRKSTTSEATQSEYPSGVSDGRA